jgi:hypothetical protein
VINLTISFKKPFLGSLLNSSFSFFNFLILFSKCSLRLIGSVLNKLNDLSDKIELILIGLEGVKLFLI